MHAGTQHLADNEDRERCKGLPQLGIYHLSANPPGPQQCRIRPYQRPLAVPKPGGIHP